MLHIEWDRIFCRLHFADSSVWRLYTGTCSRSNASNWPHTAHRRTALQWCSDRFYKSCRTWSTRCGASHNCAWRVERFSASVGEEYSLFDRKWVYLVLMRSAQTCALRFSALSAMDFSADRCFLSVALINQIQLWRPEPRSRKLTSQNRTSSLDTYGHSLD